jgi:hypothetical protein
MQSEEHLMLAIYMCMPGRFAWSIGDTYEGEWHKDAMHGKGTTRYKNGNVYSGGPSPPLSSF